MKKLLVAGIVLTVAITSAHAADMPVKASLYTKAPAVSADPWTGWYLGVSAGGRFDNDKWTATGFESPPVGLFLTGRDNPHEFSLSSARLGLYGGYNWRVQQMWVVGLEADFAWANKTSSNAGIPGLLFPLFPQTDSTAVKNTWDGGLRGRLGYLITPVTLLYATGGVSWMKSEASVTCGGPTSALCSGNNFNIARTDNVSKVVVGWTLGGGLETMIVPNWFLRGEYRYTSYASYHASLLQDGALPTPANNQVDADIKIRTQTALIGLAYKFGQ